MWVRHRARRRGRGQVLGAPCDAFGHDCVASQTRDTNIFNLCNCVFGDTCVRFDLRRSRSPCARCAHTHHSARGGRCCGGRRRARGNEHARAAGDGSRRARGAGRTSQEIDRARSRVRPHRRRRAHRTVRAAARACVRVDRRSDRTALFPSSTKKGSRAGGGGRAGGQWHGLRSRHVWDSPPCQASEELYARTAIAQAEGVQISTRGVCASGGLATQRARLARTFRTCPRNKGLRRGQMRVQERRGRRSRACTNARARKWGAPWLVC